MTRISRIQNNGVAVNFVREIRDVSEIRGFPKSAPDSAINPSVSAGLLLRARQNNTSRRMGTLPARLARGDQAAFAELYDACADRVGHYLLVRLCSREDAND